MRSATFAFVGLVLGVSACESGEFEYGEPSVYFASNGNYEISLSDTLELQPKIVYDYKSAYKWTLDNVVVSDQLNYTFIPDGLKDYNLSFTVSNDKGTSSKDILISVVKTFDFSSFENYKVPKKSTLAMKADTLVEKGFVVDGIKFPNYILAVDTLGNPTLWSGFAFSSRTTVTTSLSTSAMGCAYSSSAHPTYMAVCCYEVMPKVMFDASYIIKSLDVAWDNFSYLVSRFGVRYESGLAVRNAAKDDVINLDIYGLDENGVIIGQTSCNLLNCESDNASQYFRLTSWQTLDLRSLGAVRGLAFGISSTIADFPPFFCIDELKLQD